MTTGPRGATARGRGRILSLAWLFLVAATVFIWWLGTAIVRGDPGAHAGATAVIFLLVGAKIHLVMRQFMEAGRAPFWLRAALIGWILAVGLGIAVVVRG